MAHTVESRQRALEKLRQRRRIWLAENGPCVECGSWEDLEVDHVDPTTKISHNVWSWSDSRRDAELAKCQVLCRMHHRAKTSEENSLRMGGLKHGTEKMYRKGKCRCDECMEFRRLTKRRDYAKIKSKTMR